MLNVKIEYLDLSFIKASYLERDLLSDERNELPIMIGCIFHVYYYNTFNQMCLIYFREK